MFPSFEKLSPKKEHLIVVALLFNAFSWYYLGQLAINRMGYAFVEGSFEHTFLGATYAISIVISAIAGTVFLTKRDRLQILRGWVILGILTSLVTAVSTSSSFSEMLVIVCLLGFSLGIGMPFCLELLTKLISIENRGKIGGAVLFATFFSVPFLYMGTSSLDMIANALSLALWRSWSLPLLFLISEKENFRKIVAEKPKSFILALRNKTFLLYFTAWLMFAFIDSFQTVVVSAASNKFNFFMKAVEPSVAGFSAPIIGAISDRAGRKRVLISGFVCLGIAYAVIGLAPQSWIFWLFFFVVDGIAIGSLWVLFTVIIWGEISIGNTEKFYAIGEAPLFLTETISLLLAPYLVFVPQNSSFSLASFFLFVAVIPLLFAPETLPEKKIRERELKEYIEKAKKIKEKYVKE